VKARDFITKNKTGSSIEIVQAWFDWLTTNKKEAQSQYRKSKELKTLVFFALDKSIKLSPKDLEYILGIGTKKVLLGINTLDISQGEIMDEAYEEDITIHISKTELEKFEKYFGNIIRLTVKE